MDCGEEVRVGRHLSWTFELRSGTLDFDTFAIVIGLWLNSIYLFKSVLYNFYFLFLF